MTPEDEDDFMPDEDGSTDPEYLVPDHAMPDSTPKGADPDAPNKSILEDIQKYLIDQIKTHNSFDAILPEAEGIMTVQQQVQMHKQVVVHLRNIKSTVDSKLKEL